VSSITRAGCAILDAVKPYGARDPSWRVKRDVSLSDRHLVEWVAQAKVGDPFPEPWKWASEPIESIIRTLVGLGVIERPAPDVDLATVAQDAAVAARAWLKTHPPAPPSGPAGQAIGRGLR
jgi:hypothetical protein